MLEVTVKVWEIMLPVLKKRKAAVGRIWKKGSKSGMKERAGDEKLIIITNKCNC